MKKFTLIFFICWAGLVSAQEEVATETVWRLNFINPGVEFETPVSSLSTFSTNFGIGYNGSYPELTFGGDTGIVYVIAPFLDIQYKHFYNLDKRNAVGKNVEENSGNFISARIVARGSSIADNVIRKSDFDFAIGPTWGIQRAFGKIHFLFDVGPQFYFDTEGNNGFWLLMAQLNIGLNLYSKR
ncbi:hypothetical protein [Cochleicola gelatinilyticus]|uniref:Outer membrane protein beta-barrel domain-containing protein n=1 Tax=Cochleicola gelatinilyticus TaxID=1763537 RepID=A0A167IEP3_9FLAO|nr:hypothetical protein [Cochleicola gelatinilyticus]OAB79577.1 hypothetical protein ULVI_02155 [Cochleicola gelatinilyticus]